MLRNFSGIVNTFGCGNGAGWLGAEVGMPGIGLGADEGKPDCGGVFSNIGVVVIER